MKKLATLILAMILNFSSNAFSPERLKAENNFSRASAIGEPIKALENTVLTYIENYHAGDFMEMTTVLHEDFSNQIVNEEGRLSHKQDIEDLKRLMSGQKQVAPEKQKNTVTITKIENNKAQVTLETGTEVARWYEYITLVKEAGNWKVKKVLWRFK